MGERDSSSDRRIEELVRRVDDLERRLHRLETGAAPVATVQAVEEAEPEQGAEALTGGVPLGGLVTMLGRTFLIMGGAWLLRAAVERGGLALGVGVALGLVYATAWYVLADREARRERFASALFYGLAAAAIGAPIVWESVARHGLIEPALAAAILGGLGLVGLVVAWRGRMQSYAVLNTLATTGAGLALMVQTRAFLPFGLALLAIGAVAVGTSYVRRWRVLPWLSVVPLDLGICLALVWLRDPDFAQRLSPPNVTLLLAATWAVFAGLVAWRGLQRGGPLGRFSVAQMLFAFLAGYEGAHWIASDGGAAWLPAAAVVASVAWWGAALLASRRLAGEEHRDFFSGPHVPYVLGAFALLMLLDGTARLMPLGFAGVLWGVLAVAAVYGDCRNIRFLEPYAVLFAVAATAGSGLGAGAYDALAASAVGAWRPLFALEPMVTLGLLGLAFVMLPRCETRRPLAGTGVGLLVLAGLGALVVSVLAGPVAGAPGPDADPGALAVLRTAILAASALLLAVLYRYTGRRRLSWLTVAVLVAGGVKLVLEDLGSGEAGLLFLSFALYGLALILAPRIVRGARGGGEGPARVT